MCLGLWLHESGIPDTPRFRGINIHVKTIRFGFPTQTTQHHGPIFLLLFKRATHTLLYDLHNITLNIAQTENTALPSKNKLLRNVTNKIKIVKEKCSNQSCTTGDVFTYDSI